MATESRELVEDLPERKRYKQLNEADRIAVVTDLISERESGRFRRGAIGKVAKKFGVTRTTVRRLWDRYKTSPTDKYFQRKQRIYVSKYSNEAVAQRVEALPPSSRQSLRTISSELNIPRTSLWKILKDNADAAKAADSSETSRPQSDTSETTTEAQSEPAVTSQDFVKDNAASLKRLIREYTECAAPLVRFTFNTTNTTTAERQNICKAALLITRRGPNVPAGNLPVSFVGINGLAFVGDPGAEATEFRFAGAQQVANWIADAQSRGYNAGVGVVRFSIQLTSDNGGHWSDPFEVVH